MTDTEILRQLYRDMYEAMIQKDIWKLDAMLAPDFVLVHMTGMRQTKEEYLEAIQNGTLNYFSENTEHIEIRIQGDKAKVMGKSRVNAAVFGGGRYTWPLQQNLTAEKNGENWTFTGSTASTY